MQLEFHQLDRPWEHLRVRHPARQRRLLASLADSGQQTPIVVVAAESQADRYVVIDGYKRIAALEQLGRDTIDAVVWPMSEAEAVLLDRSLRLSEHETALEVGWLLAELELRFGYRLDELARRFDRSVSWVSRRPGVRSTGFKANSVASTKESNRRSNNPMLSQAQRTTIVELDARGVSRREIARVMGISRVAVRKVLRSKSTEVPELHRAEKAEPYRPQILELFGQCKGNLVRVHEELPASGAELSYTALTAFCRRHGIGQTPPVAAGRYEFAPGEKMQHDTSQHELELAGKNRKVQTASAVLCYSRMLFFQCYPRFQRFDCKVFLTEALRYFSGAAAGVMIDNTHVVVLRGTGRDMVPVPEMDAFAERFGFRFVAHAIGDANRSARVERPFGFIEGNFLAGRSNAWWISKAMSHCTPTTTPFHWSGSAAAWKCAKPRTRSRSNWMPAGWSRTAVLPRPPISGSCWPGTGRRAGKRAPRPDSHPEEKAILTAAPELAGYVAELKQHSRKLVTLALRQLLRLVREYPREAVLGAVREAAHYGLYDLDRLERMILRRVAREYFLLEGGSQHD